VKQAMCQLSENRKSSIGGDIPLYFIVYSSSSTTEVRSGDEYIPCDIH